MTERTMFQDMEAGGSRIPMMCKTLRDNGWVTFEHHDNWIKKEWENDHRKFNGVDLGAAYAIAMIESRKENI